MLAPVRTYDLVVIGGGAAGIFAAVNAARLGANWKVLVVEKSEKLLAKVKVSGGGRCNVTHACFDKHKLPSYYPRGSSIIKKVVHQFFTTDTIDWFQQRGVPLKEESDGRMFPVSNQSQAIIDVLLQEAARYHVEFRMRAGVQSIQKDADCFTILLSDGTALATRHCCLACGGLTTEKAGTFIKQMGHTIIPAAPSLFTFNASPHPMHTLMGISVPSVRVRIAGTKLEETGPLLITHWGFSGPVVLRLSAWGARHLQSMQYTFTAQVNWLEGQGWTSASLPAYFQEQRQLHATQLVANSTMFQLPRRLWDYFLNTAEISPMTQFANLTKKQENRLIKLLTDMDFSVRGKTTFKEEFVTAGGVDCSEIDALTMQSKRIPGLYFAGEVMDVDGITGGFNFQHAWSSAYLAAAAMTTTA